MLASMHRFYLLPAITALSLAACSAPPPATPPPDKTPPPQADQLSNAIHRPIDQAKDARDAVQQAQADQGEQIDAAAGR